MKKFTAFLLAVMMVATCLIVSACQPDNKDCNHKWEFSSKQAPTCSEEGGDIYICKKCQETEFRKTSDPNDHDWKYSTGTKTTCTEPGTSTYVCSACQETKTEISRPAYGHNWEAHEVKTSGGNFKGYYYQCERCNIIDNPNADDYFNFTYTSTDGGNFTRLESERVYDDVFVYTFSDEIKAEIDGVYDNVIANLEQAEKYDASKHQNLPTKDANGNDVYDHTAEYYIANKEGFEHELYDPYVAYLDYITEQYQYAYVFYCVYDNDEWEAKYNSISDFRTETIKNYYALFRKIYETQYREFFFSLEEGWTEDEIQVALTMSDSYGKEEYAALNKRAEEILTEFRDIKNADTDSKVLDLYEELVGINNQIAALAGYDNYVEYAYENVYEREYSPEDVEKMRNYCKQYLAPLFRSILPVYKSSGKTSFSGMAANYKDALMKQSIFDSPLTTNIVSDYLKELSSNDFGKEISFFDEVNKLFKNGNYFTGKHKGAFSYYIPAQDATILFFGPGNYSGAFTFIHEFGHYYQNIYNPGLSLNMDHDETQSQGNEMLMLAWLEDYLDEKLGNIDHTDLYTTVKYDNIFNAMAIVLLATAVDEFEQAVYLDTWGTKPIYKDISKNEYDALFEEIMKDYGIAGSLNSSYWRYVTIEAPCYYISYAMSALPSMGIYVKAQREGFDAAKESYLKLFAFSDEESLCKVLGDQDNDGIINKEVTATYEQILNYCGLLGPFQEQLYIDLEQYLN